MMYHKFINDREVFSTCKTIELNGAWVSNPTAEQIAAAGWEEYVPPVVPPAPQTEPGEGDVLEAVKQMLSGSAAELTDEEALAVAALFPTWKSKLDAGEKVTAADRLWYDGKLYRPLQEHVPQADWTPDVTPALYKEVSLEEWPEWVQPVGSEDAYKLNDPVSHNGEHWRSDYDANTWEPGVFGWRKV